MANHGHCGAGTSRPQSAWFALPASGVPAPSEALLFENSQPVPSPPHDYSGTEAFLRNTHTTTPLNPLGVKGIGEDATIGATPAIVMLKRP